MRHTQLSSERGVALVVVLLLVLIVATVASSASLLTLNTSLVSRYSERLGVLEAVTDAGLEEGRAAINGDKTLYPDTGFAALEVDVQAYDAAGDPIPNVTRSTYVGPTGVTSGQYGVFGSVVTVAEDTRGNRVVRRLEVIQESFAKYAYFTDIEPSNISFGGGDQLFGPVHTNDYLKIYASGATFHSSVTTAKTVQGAQYGTFVEGYTEYAPEIPMPETADLTKLQSQAQAGSAEFSVPVGGALRIEFVAVDLNNDGSVTGADEGFMRIYTSSDAGWLRGDVPADYSSQGLRSSRNCGHYHPDGTFIDALSHPASGPDSWVAAVSSSTRRCYLGGSDSLTGGFVASSADGQWLPWGGTVDPRLAGRPDAGYLHPITRALNPSFKGVIYVGGDVAISGVVRGQVTLAASGDIYISDDVTYAVNPGSGTCTDMLGLFAGDDIIMDDNTLNSPIRPTSASNYFTYDDTKDEFVQAVILALDIFTVQDYASGATKAEPCENSLWGRGCLYLTGGIIQRQRGAVGTIRNPGGTGYLKRYSYDACAFSSPPPYYPTTGHFARGRLFQLDPVDFSVSELFDLLTAGQ